MENKESHWVRGEDGLYHEVTTVTVIECGEGEIVSDGKCIPKDGDKEATASLFKDETDCRNNKEQKYTEGVLNYTHYNPEYQENLSYSCVPQIIKPFNNNTGVRENWHGYSVCLEHGAPVLRDSDGVAVTATQAAGQAKFVCEKTGDSRACGAVRIDACSANHDPEKLGMICAFDKNGKETLISGEGFTRESLEAAGNISKKDAEAAAVRNTAKSGDLLGTFRSQTKSITSIIKDIFGTDRKVTVTEVSGEESVGEQKKSLTEKAKDGGATSTTAENQMSKIIKKGTKAVEIGADTVRDTGAGKPIQKTILTQEVTTENGQYVKRTIERIHNPQTNEENGSDTNSTKHSNKKLEEIQK